MNKIFFLLSFPILLLCQEHASFQLEVGGRWDLLRLTGSGTNIIATQNGALIDGPLTLIGLNRKLADLNLFHVGATMQFIAGNALLFRGLADYGIFFSDPRELFQGALQNPNGLSLLFLGNRNSLDYKQFSLDLSGQIGLLAQVTNHLQLGFATGYGYYLLRMSEKNRVEVDSLLGLLLVSYRITPKWQMDFEIEGSFFGHFDQIVTFAPQAPQTGSLVTISPGRIKTNHIRQYAGVLGLRGSLGPRWALALCYKLRHIYTSSFTTPSFGGTIKGKCYWSAQKLSIVLSYSY